MVKIGCNDLKFLKGVAEMNKMEDLFAYKGSTKKPDDFDAYWQAGLDELAAHDPNVSLEESEFQVKGATCYDLYFTGLGGSRIYVKYIKPKVSKKVPAILQFHGYMYHSGEWAEKLNYLSQGYAVFAMDCRGQAGKSEDLQGSKGTTVFGHVIKGLSEGKNSLYYRYVFLDTVLLVQIVMAFESINEDEVYVMGMSQGGGLSLACAALEPRIKKVAVENPFLSDFKKVLEMGASRENYRIMDYFRVYDPLHENEDEIFKTLSYIDIHHLTSKIKGRVLFGVGLQDDVCPPLCQFAAYNHITAPKQLKVYPDYAHEHLNGFADLTMQFFNQDA